MAGTETKRIIELTEASTVQSGDFIAVDSNARGTKKVPTSALATSAALTAETNARAGADEQMSERMDGIEEQTALIQNPTKTLSGALVSFTDGADMPMVACTAEIVPKQSGTGTPSPDNVRPISGWESVNVNVAGVNVWDEEWRLGYYNGSNGEYVYNSSQICNTNPISVKPSTAYYLKTPSNLRVVFYRNDMSFIRATITGSGVFNTPDDCCFVGFNTFQNPPYPSGATYRNDISINYPSTDHDYHAYNGHTTTTPLGRTVYGGTLDVVSGVLTVDRAMVTYNGSENWGMETGPQYTGSSFYIAKPSGTGNKYDVFQSNITNKFTLSMSAAQDGVCITAGYFNCILGNILGINNVADFKTWLSSHNMQIVYPLATAQTYTLTGQEVSTLLGENNVWADSGDVEITYRRDISIVINNLESALNG